MSYLDKGSRVRLLSCSDPHTRLEPGALGTVVFVDDLGTVHVRWDDGHSLGLIPGEDRFEPVLVDVVQSRRNRWTQTAWSDVLGLDPAEVPRLNAEYGWEKYRVETRPVVAS